jgi:hypothetical protein
MNWNAGLWNTWRLPFVTTWPTPRPAMNITSVPTIGCTWKRVMNQPLNSPSTPATPIGTTKASASPSPGWARPNGLRKINGAKAPAIAISEPTERSMPPVAMTSVMPTETMTMVATWVRLTFSVWKLTKCGVTARLNTNSAMSPVSAA